MGRKSANLRLQTKVLVGRHTKFSSAWARLYGTMSLVGQRGKGREGAGRGLEGPAANETTRRRSVTRCVPSLQAEGRPEVRLLEVGSCCRGGGRRKVEDEIDNCGTQKEAPASDIPY